jgi:hypothetical protein
MATATRICRDKTNVGNLYRREEIAVAYAALLAKATGADVHAYRCQVCGCWHVGRRYKRAALKVMR